MMTGYAFNNKTNFTNKSVQSYAKLKLFNRLSNC